jgi:hypothetical protein
VFTTTFGSKSHLYPARFFVAAQDQRLRVALLLASMHIMNGSAPGCAPAC